MSEFERCIDQQNESGDSLVLDIKPSDVLALDIKLAKRERRWNRFFSIGNFALFYGSVQIVAAEIASSQTDEKTIAGWSVAALLGGVNALSYAVKVKNDNYSLRFLRMRQDNLLGKEQEQISLQEQLSTNAMQQGTYSMLQDHAQTDPMQHPDQPTIAPDQPQEIEQYLS